MMGLKFEIEFNIINYGARIIFLMHYLKKGETYNNQTTFKFENVNT